MIEALSQSSIVDVYDGESYYVQIRKTGENKIDDITCGTYDIIFSSNQSTIKINKYIEYLMKSTSKSADHEFTIYNINVEKNEKHRKLSWNHNRSISNKTIKNVIVSEKVQKDFYDDMATFWEREEKYNTRGITFKRGYLIHGPPGSGKSSLISSIINEHELPVFKMDMSIIRENEELNQLNSTIYDYIGMSERHIVLMEDIDRCALFDRYNRDTRVTMDAFLNMLDGIDGTHGRITIMTANEIDSLVCVKGLLRPGRIDRKIELTNCDDLQIRKILALNFDKNIEDVKVDGVKTTPASLNKLIQIIDDFDLIVKYLETYKELDDDELETLDVEKITNSKPTTNDAPPKSKPKSRYNRRGRPIRERKKSDKPKGFLVMERLKKKIAKEEMEIAFAVDKHTIDHEIRCLMFKKMQLELNKRQKVFDENQKNQEQESNSKKLDDDDSQIDIDKLEDEICSESDHSEDDNVQVAEPDEFNED
jgi:AAA+ superfamily predicted ATPase